MQTILDKILGIKYRKQVKLDKSRKHSATAQFLAAFADILFLEGRLDTRLYIMLFP